MTSPTPKSQYNLTKLTTRAPVAKTLSDGLGGLICCVWHGNRVQTITLVSAVPYPTRYETLGRTLH